MKFDILDIIVLILVGLVSLLVYSCSRPCECPKVMYNDPVTAFVMSQPDIAIDVTKHLADKNPNQNLKPKGWDKL